MNDTPIPKTLEERLEFTMEVYGVGETEAEFLMAIEDGKRSGDAIEINDNASEEG